MMYRFLIIVLLWATGVSVVQADPKSLLGQVLAYQGKSYPSVRIPDFVSYDMVLRHYLVERIQRRFGVNLDPRQYSCFDLLEIEAFFRCKKSTESPDLLLKGFPKHR
jgi:hypothetical protein